MPITIPDIPLRVLNAVLDRVPRENVEAFLRMAEEGLIRPGRFFVSRAANSVRCPLCALADGSGEILRNERPLDYESKRVAAVGKSVSLVDFYWWFDSGDPGQFETTAEERLAAVVAHCEARLGLRPSLAL